MLILLSNNLFKSLEATEIVSCRPLQSVQAKHHVGETTSVSPHLILQLWRSMTYLDADYVFLKLR